MRFPVPMKDRFAALVSGHEKSLGLHTQQITQLQSQVAATSALVPGSWENITLQNGWSNVSGSIPAQARLLTSTTVQIIANIAGTVTADGTIIGTLTAGFFNTVHAHTFGITAVSGAAAVASAVSQGSLQTITGTADVGGGTNIPATDHTFSLSGSSFASGSLKMGPSSGNQISNNVGGSPFTLASGNLNNNQSTNINYNRPACTLGTDGTLKLLNVNPNVTHISFHEAGLPLFTA
jgi:hypothetical protein